MLSSFSRSCHTVPRIWQTRGPNSIESAPFQSLLFPMKLRVSHLTRYEYAQSVSFSPHALYLRPRETPFLRVGRFKFNISPNAKVTTGLDSFDNIVTSVYFWDRAPALNIRTEFEVETLESNPFDFILRHDASHFPIHYEPYERYALATYLAAPSAEAQDAIRLWVDQQLPERPTETLPLLTAINQALCSAVEYQRREHGGPQDVVTTLQSGIGASRDYAVALIEICRTLGFAARFVSGYSLPVPRDERTETHAMQAWTEVYLPGAGWKALDPSRGIFCTDTYIPVAHAPVAECVSPVQGSYYSTVHVPSQLTINVLVESLIS